MNMIAYSRHFISTTAIHILTFTFSFIFYSFGISLAQNTDNQLLSIISKEESNGFEIRIISSNQPAATIYGLPDPSRIVVDIADADLTDEFKQQLSGLDKVSVSIKEILDAKPTITRIELIPKNPFDFRSDKNENSIILTINNVESPVSTATSNITSDKNSSNNADKPDFIKQIVNNKANIESKLPELNPLDKKLSKQAIEQQIEDSFNFSGYNKERITVEFQKMDLHNVFNFLRQVSGVNIVVDEAVEGSLTLVLDNVPWDFALDIILNLKDLEKEERFNTLVIYPKCDGSDPKCKGFTWPKQADNNLSFEASTEIIEQESLVISQQDRQPLEVVEAKQRMGMAREAEKRDDFETAIQLYEQAFAKWPTNAKLANKISSLYLVQLRQNAKALHYAKQSLQINADDSTAILNAAIAAANMRDYLVADEFFKRSIKVTKPSKEALLSYAVFCEEQRKFEEALSAIEKHDTIYGKDLGAMVSTARIYDKMGKQPKATETYKTILLSGFHLPPDLDTYIRGRIAFIE